MKGNETRVVIFLQPVNPPKEGQVSTLKQSKWKFSPLFLVLGALLGLGMLAFVLLTIKSDVNSGLDSTTVPTEPTIKTTITNTTTTEPTTMEINTTASTLKTTTEITIPSAATTISSRHLYL